MTTNWTDAQLKELIAGTEGTGPFKLERHDQDDGSIDYEIWDYNPASYRRLCKLNDDKWSEHMSAKVDATIIVTALNNRATVRLLCEALLAARAALKWQPIETAPKDGTPILALFPWRTGAVRYVTRFIAGKWTDGEVSEILFPNHMQSGFTHWRALPPGALK